MKKLLSLLCVLSLSAALLAGFSTAGDAGTSETPGSSSTPSDVTEMADPIDVNVMALKGPTAMGMVEFMNEADSGTITDNNYHFNITAATDEVSAALAQGTTDIAAVPANLASVLYNNTEGGVQGPSIRWACFTLWRAETRYTPWRTSGARPFTPAARETHRRPP